MSSLEVNTFYGIPSLLRHLENTKPEGTALCVITLKHTDYKPHELTFEFMSEAVARPLILMSGEKMAVHRKDPFDAKGVYYTPCGSNGEPLRDAFVVYNTNEGRFVSHTNIQEYAHIGASYYSYEGWVRLFGNNINAVYDEEREVYVIGSALFSEL